MKPRPRMRPVRLSAARNQGNLCVQQGNRVGNSRPWRGARRGGWEWGHQGAAGALVTPYALLPLTSIARNCPRFGRSDYWFTERCLPLYFALRGKPLFRASKPGELCVQQGDGVGGGWPGRNAERGGLGWRRYQCDPGAADALVAPESSAATRADKA
jgi:hypothetical protein